MEAALRHFDDEGAMDRASIVLNIATEGLAFQWQRRRAEAVIGGGR